MNENVNGLSIVMGAKQQDIRLSKRQKGVSKTQRVITARYGMMIIVKNVY